jgi:K+-transporting ATPase KdpF subunit
MGSGSRMSYSQIILLIVAVAMFGFLGYAMFKPEKF